MPEYLDFNGLTRYNNKIKAINATLANNGVKNLLNFDNFFSAVNLTDS